MNLVLITLVVSSGKGPLAMVLLQSPLGHRYSLTYDIQPGDGMNQDLNIMTMS